MATLTVRQLRDETQQRLREVAARNGRSMEAEVRMLLERTYGRDGEDERIARIRAMSGREFADHLIRTANGAILELPQRTGSAEREIFGAD